MLALTEDRSSPAPTPWRSIWLSPRRTIRELIEKEQPDSWVPAYLIASLAGVLKGLNGVWARSSLRPFPIRGMVLAVVLSLALLWVTAGLLSFFGRWRGGVGTPAQLRLALGWSCVPAAVSLLVWGPVWVLCSGPFPNPSTGVVAHAVASGLVFYAATVAPVWSFALCVGSIAAAHRLSIWRTIDFVAATAFFGFLFLAACLATLGKALALFS